MTQQELRAAAADRGLALELSVVGPAVGVTCRKAGGSGGEQDVVAELEGFVVPPVGPFRGLLHLDSLRVYNSRLRGVGGPAARTVFGVGLLTGAAAVVHAAAAVGCERAELLAILDDEEQHRRLVRYYERLGFERVCDVRQVVADIPHLLVWGGEGTRMDADLALLCDRWSAALRRMQAAGAP